ncbi:MAG: HlyD family efflux transporter periplasmic adaptor subunit [Stenotrophomonas maltophilia]
MDIARPEMKQRKHQRKRIVIGVSLLSFIAVVGGVVALTSSHPSVRRADIVIDTVRQGEFVRSVRGPGKLVSSQMRWVVAKTDASIERLLVRPGANVSADTDIIEMTNPEVMDRLLVATAEHAAAQGDHAALQARLQGELLQLKSELSSTEGERDSLQVEEQAARRALEKGVLAEVEYKKIAIKLRQYEQALGIARERVAQSASSIGSQLTASRARVQQLESTAQLRQAEADGLRVKAGMEGVVQQITVEEGQRVASGVNIARIARPGELIAELRIPESQAADLAAGQSATLEIGRTNVPGKVRRVNPAVEKGTILVEVDLAGALPSGTRAEQSVDGVITTDRIAGTLFVNRPVNIHPGSTNPIYRLSGNGAASRVEVRFGKDSVNEVQVLDGLKQGDQIVLSDMSEFSDSNEVSIQ